MPKPPSLKAQALALLARREHSRAELRVKLMRHARKLHDANADANDSDSPSASLTHEVEQVLDWLQAQRYQSDTRFAESRIHRRSASHGSARIRQELAQHQVELPTQALLTLRDTEWQRAQALWLKRYGAPAQDAREQARQARFLLSRGFSGDIVRKLTQSTRRDES